MKESFNDIVEQAMRIPGRAHMRPVIEKELLHYDILFALSQAKLLDSLTFQGGTSLRLCHRAPRFSEDLDFAGGIDFDVRQLHDIGRCLEDYLGARYELDVRVKKPSARPFPGREGNREKRSHYVAVAKWQVVIQTAPRRRDLPHQRIKLEVANVPAYSRQLRTLARNYDFLPDGYADVLIGVETLDEIMADKLVSLPLSQKRLRHRDIWDLRWLAQQGAQPSVQWVTNKVGDYGQMQADYLQKLDAMASRLPDIVSGTVFNREMSRFLPQDVQARTIQAKGFDVFLASEVADLLHRVRQALVNTANKINEPFKM